MSTLSTGAPSQPSTPTYSVSGTIVTVLVAVRYPGTRGVVRLYIGHQSVGNVQSGEVEERVPVTDPSEGIMRRIDIELPVGQYRVYVRAENEFGNSTSEISDVLTITSKLLHIIVTYIYVCLLQLKYVRAFCSNNISYVKYDWNSIFICTVQSLSAIVGGVIGAVVGGVLVVILVIGLCMGHNKVKKGL